MKCPPAFTSLLFACLLSRAPGAMRDDPTREVRWLESGSGAILSTGATWGAPWQPGAIPQGSTFELIGADGKAVPMQSWPLAFWPDGSVKWSAHAIPAGAGLAGPLRLEPGERTDPAKPVSVSEQGDLITVDTGVIQCAIHKSGDTLIESIVRDGKTLAAKGGLVCRLRSSPDLDADGMVQQDSFHGEVSSATVEQSGPVRVVIRIEGTHVGAAGRKWLPFVVRLYFYAGGDAVRIVHTVIFDGDQNKDFVSGLGIRFSVPLKDALYDRHIRFATDGDGVFGEAVQGMTGLQADPGADVRQAQVAGKKTPPVETWKLFHPKPDKDALPDKHPVVPSDLGYIPAFGDFTLAQLSPDAFEIRKRTKPGFTWLNSLTGRRAAGLGYVGGPSGGMAFGIRNFWQSYPSQLSVRDATSGAAEVTAWLWSPEARPMDMRFFHDDMGMTTFETENQGGKLTYEDYEPGFATATGVARTSELMLWALPATPANTETAAMARTLRAPPQLACRPQDYKDAGVFGGAIWSPVDRSNPVQARIEDQLDAIFDYYKKEADERHWYGFWYYGNVMHRYDLDRHTWRYDVGAYAWDNSEQSTDIWLWYSFLRSGRADIFRFAEAMTRHTGEVDVYHMGRFAGLGTRHGVVPWGDSSKQLRVSTAENRRFFYYLTADERTGDLMREELTADRTAGQVPVERKVQKEMAEAKGKPYPMNFLIGIEWSSAASAWLTEWERTGDTKWRERLVAGMKSIAALPHGFLSGGGGYDPATGQFVTRDDKFYMSPLSAAFGEFEVNAELLQLLDVPAYEKAWLEYCKYYNAPLEEQQKEFGPAFQKDMDALFERKFKQLYLTQEHARLTAYAAWRTRDDALAARAWKEFLDGGGGGLKVKPFPVRHFAGPEVPEPMEETDLSTNVAAGFGLSAINCLGLIKDKLPAKVAP